MSEERPRKRLPVRWVTLGEAVAIAAVAVSALGLYNGWGSKEQPAPIPQATATARPLTLKATVEREGSRLKLAPAVAEQVVGSQTISFPSALKVAPVETSGDPRIEASWFERPLRRLMEDAPAAAGDRRLPILVTTRYVDGAAERTDVAAYSIGYVLEEGGLFGGGGVRLRGLSLLDRNVKDGQQRLDVMWRPNQR